MVSSDLRELMAVCDRIGVMSAGRLVAVFERGQWTQHLLLEAAFSAYAATERPPAPAAATTSTIALRTSCVDLSAGRAPGRPKPARSPLGGRSAVPGAGGAPLTDLPLTRRSALANALGTFAGLLVALALMVGLFSALSQYFFTSDTFVTIANDIPAVAVTAVGMTYVLIIAGIDLSVGSVMALASAVAGLAMMRWGWPLAPALGMRDASRGLVVGARSMAR